MSDEESIISEELDYRSDVDSTDYQAFERSDDAEDRIRSIRTQKSVPVVTMQKNDQVKVPSRDIPRSVPKIINAASISDDDSNDYSAEFEETMAQSNATFAYSNDFEDEGEKRLPETPVRQTLIGIIKNKDIDSITAPIEQQVVRLPGINIASLQAEIALEDISKEVVRLRNQQRNLLQERRQVAREKKSRADSRRAQYDMELRDIKCRLKLQEHENETLSAQFESVTKSLEIMTYGKKLVEADLALKEDETATIKEKFEKLQIRMKECEETLSNEKNLNRINEEKWAAEKHTLKADILRYNLLSTVVQQSLEASEARLNRERERLPEEHRRLLEEQIARNKNMEGSLIDRERSLRAEEQRRFAQLEVRSREASEEVVRVRMKVEVEIADARDRIENEKNNLEHEKQKLESKIALEKKEISLQVLDLTRREANFKLDVNNFNRAQANFESAKASVEPMLQATSEDREAAVQILKKAETVLVGAEKRSQEIIAAENGLRKMEQELMERESEIEEIRAHYLQAHRLIQREASNLLISQKDFSAEKFRLHSATIELASQTSEFKNSMGIVSKFGAAFKASKQAEIDKYGAQNDRTKKKVEENAYSKYENMGSKGRNNENNNENNDENENESENESDDDVDKMNHDNIVNHLENEINYQQKKKKLTIITDEKTIEKNKNKNTTNISNNNDNSSSSKMNNTKTKKNTTFDIYGNISKNQNSFHDPSNYEPEQISRPSSTTNNSEEHSLAEHSPEHSQNSSVGNCDIDSLHSPPGDISNSIKRLGRISSSLKEPIRRFSPVQSPERYTKNIRKNRYENNLFSNSNYNKYSIPHDFIKENNDNSEDHLFENSRNLDGPGATSHYKSSFLHEKEIIDIHSVHSSCNFKESVRKERSPVGWEHSPGAHFTAVELQHHLRTANNNNSSNSNNYSTSLPSYINDESNTNYTFHSNVTATPIPKIDVNHYDRCHVEVEIEVENSELRGAVDRASEHASGLFAAAAKYGIYH